MIDPKNDLKFTTAGDYVSDLDEHIKVTKSDPYEVNKPSGSETWQTKANEKNKVPRYMSPSELNSMRLDKLESSLLRLAKDLRGRMDTLESRLHSLEKSMENK